MLPLCWGPVKILFMGPKIPSGAPGYGIICELHSDKLLCFQAVNNMSQPATATVTPWEESKLHSARGTKPKKTRRAAPKGLWRDTQGADRLSHHPQNLLRLMIKFHSMMRCRHQMMSLQTRGRSKATGRGAQRLLKSQSQSVCLQRDGPQMRAGGNWGRQRNLARNITKDTKWVRKCKSKTKTSGQKQSV